MNRVIALLPLASLLGCQSGGDSDTDTDVPIAMTCPGYTGLHGVGSTWSWETTEAWSAANNGMTGAWDVTIETITPDTLGESVAVAVTAVGHTDTDGVPFSTYTSHIGFRCDVEGSWLVSTVVDSTTEIAGNEYVDHNVVTYDVGERVMIPDATVGSAWTSSPSGNVTDTFGGSATFANTVERNVVAATTTTVPAGTFETLDVAGVSSVDNVEVHSLVDADAGPVADGGAQLVSVQMAP